MPAPTTCLATEFERGFSCAAGPTVGLEEELILVEPRWLEPTGEIDRILTAVGADPRFKTELRAAQVELVTPVCGTVADACSSLASARALLVETINGRVRLVAAGTHPASVAAIAITERPRYTALADDNPWFVRCGIPSALHVHVGVDDADDALAVYNAARSYLPEIAALAANSPLFEGRDSGLASSRLKLCEDSPRAGIPPAFASWRELAEFVEWGARGRLFSDVGDLWWDLRPRPDYGTIEFRIADVQTDVPSSGCVAALCQSLVVALQARVRRGESLPVHATHVLNENRWRALRDGLDGELVDPVTGRSEPTSDRLGRLLDELEPHARQLGCSQQLAQARTLIVDGGGAGRQRAIARKRGVGGLLAWLADTTEAAPSTLQADAHPATAPELRPDPAPRSKTIGQLDRAPSLRGVSSVAR